MSPSLLLAALLAGVVLVASVRLWLRARGGRERAWRTAVLLVGQAASAALLYFALLPPTVPAASGALVVLTAKAGTPRDVAPGDVVVALPEADESPGAQRVPDLGTALRRHPGARPVRVVGEGLVPRDRDAARGVPLSFTPSALPSALVELSAPTQATAGRRFDVQGRIEGGAAVSVDLVDPAGARVARAAPDPQGRFALHATTGAPGRVDYRLQWRDAEDAVREDIALPLDVAAGAPLRLWLLAGGPSPELKYLRRWAVDAGLALRTQVSVGGGVELGDPPLPVNAATLRNFDAVVLDERAWRNLGAGGRAALREAAREGLGVMLRITGDLSAGDRSALREWGFDLANSDLPRSVRLPGTETADAAARRIDGSDEIRATDTAPVLTRRPLAATAADGVPLLRDTRGDTLALWRAQGRGRVALWWLSDSYRLALSGRSAAFGGLWAASLETLARPKGALPPAVPAAARVDERSVICGLADDAALRAPDASAITFARDDATGCAAFWPTQAGWHQLTAGETAATFPVRGENEAPGLRAFERREATQSLAANAAPLSGTTPPESPGPRWPWLLSWLLLSAALWWFERARTGRTPASV
ncbi:MAG: carboxypeptidase regulatory-like domain-containing protein [Arenimonas sp.]|nr:carboxypeptidase regulatory-like domain-containing protein [Arenimonas sp.]